MADRGCAASGCPGKHVARGFCHRHYRAFLKAGAPRRETQRYYGATPEQRHRLYTKQSRRGCWEWTGYKNAKGYGVLNLKGDRILAHRLSWTMENGPIPDGLFVLHRCDNPGCQRPGHLFLGTKADNNADMTAKGRRVPIAPSPGALNHAAKLTEADVKAIRASAKGGPELGRLYGVNRVTINAIKRRVLWKHIE